MFGTKYEFNSFTPSNIGIRFLANSVLLADAIDKFCKME